MVVHSYERAKCALKCICKVIEPLAIIYVAIKMEMTLSVSLGSVIVRAMSKKLS
jgi:hypothetical protein